MKTLSLKTAAILATAALLTACAGSPLEPYEVEMLKAQMAQQTLKINCPAGCEVEYKDPRDKVQIPQRTTGWDAAIAVGQSVERIVSGAVPVAGMGYLGGEAIKALTGSGAITTNTNTSIGDYSGDNSGRVGDYSGSQSGNAGVMDSYSGDQSGNAGEITSGNSGRIGSDNNHVSEPTVVEQPDPVIVGDQ